MVPSADSATEEPKASSEAPAELVRVAVGADDVAHAPRRRRGTRGRAGGRAHALGPDDRRGPVGRQRHRDAGIRCPKRRPSWSVWLSVPKRWPTSFASDVEHVGRAGGRAHALAPDDRRGPVGRQRHRVAELGNEAPPELVRVAVGVEDAAHDPSPETWNT